MSVFEETPTRRSEGEAERATRGRSMRVVSLPASILARLEQTIIELGQIEQAIQHELLPLSEDTINFDEAPVALLREQTIASGTDLTVDQPYSRWDGVAFSGRPGPDYTGTPSSKVYAAAWVGAPSSPNVCSLYDGVHTIAPFCDADGQVRAQFTPPVKSVSIEALPMWASPETLNPGTSSTPYLRALDANDGKIVEDAYQLIGNDNWGTVTLQVSQPDMQAAAMIAAVEFSVTAEASNPNVYLVAAVFDNLTFQR